MSGVVKRYDNAGRRDVGTRRSRGIVRGRGGALQARTVLGTIRTGSGPGGGVSTIVIRNDPRLAIPVGARGGATFPVLPVPLMESREVPFFTKLRLFLRHLRPSNTESASAELFDPESDEYLKFLKEVRDEANQNFMERELTRGVRHE